MKRLALGLSLLAAAAPAAAVETLYLQGPLGEQRLSVTLKELSSPEALWSGSSDLAELNRAMGGGLGRSLQTLFTTPLPLPVQSGLDNPMARQVELLLQSLVEPGERQWPLPVVQAGASLPWLRQAAASGEPLTLLTLLKALPGQERTIRLDRALPALRKISTQTAALNQQLLAQTPLPAAQPESLLDPRLARVVAVSPPQGLVFAGGLQDLAVPVLLVSGSRDLVVPAQPEAIEPFARYPKGPHRFVVARDGTHFNLPSASGGNGGSLRALLLAWVKGEPIGPASLVSDPAGLALFQLR